MLEAKYGPTRKLGHRSDAERSDRQNFIHKRLTFLWKCARLVCTFSVPAFYLWSAGIYGAIGLAGYVGSGRAEAFFCSIDPRSDQGGQGCEDCGAKLLMCPKSSVCYRTVMNITYQANASTHQKPYYQAFRDAALDLNCSDILEHKATNPLTMLLELQATQMIVSSGCINFHCQVWLNMFEFTDLCNMVDANPTCTNRYDAKPRDVPSDQCVCQLGCDLWEMAIRTGAANGSLIREVCGSLFPTSFVRRLGSAQPALPHPRLAAGGNATGPLNSDCADSRGGGGVASGPPRARGGDDEPGAVAPRLLQEADASAEWIVGEWSPCTCYMQCIPGASQRMVRCPSEGGACRGTQPATIRACTCSHCARCAAEEEMFVFMVIVFTQCGLSLLVCLAYATQSGLHPGQLIRISIVRRIMGFFCKNMSPLVSILVPATCALLVISGVRMIGSTIASWSSWEADCLRSFDLRGTFITVTSLWALQVCLGFCATTYARRSPWLHVPRRSLPFPLSKMQSLMRMLGP